MRIFTASLATETNTFSPLPVDMAAFKAGLYASPGRHPDTPTLCSAPVVAARLRGRAEGWTVIEGTAVWAEPAGLVARSTYEHLRDEILGQLAAALPVDAVVLGLHGAMVADGYDDCEGDLLGHIRTLVGPRTVVAAELDLHCHLTAACVTAADILVTFKEAPHTDFAERAVEVVDLAVRTARGEISPVMSTFDCRMIDRFRTGRQPMRGFMQRVKALEGRDGVLSISVVHGFPAADVPEMGAKTLVVTDARPDFGMSLARDLGMELFSFRGRATDPLVSLDAAFDRVPERPGAPVVLADVRDNPGGGTAGDSTFLLRRMIERGITEAAFASIWDPQAVRICFAAGPGARLPLRFGGKASAGSGPPIDAEILVTRVVPDAVQTFRESIVPMGDCAAIRVSGIDVIVATGRAQVFEPSLFANLGIAVSECRVVAVKSANHFSAAFTPLASEIIHVDAGGPFPGDPRTLGLRRVRRPIWPLDEDPHGPGSEHLRESSV